MLWWVGWITLTIVSFFAASAFWTPWIARHLGTIHNTRTAVIWVAAVFGTWMIILVPLIIVMYSKVDKAYEDARLRREQAAQKFKSILVERSKRLLPPSLARKLTDVPETIPGGHLVTAVLKDGGEIPHVYIAGRSEILGIYNYETLPFEISDLRDLKPDLLEKPPHFFTTNWLRLDGALPPS